MLVYWEVRELNLTDREHQTLLLFATQDPLTGYDLHSKKKEDGSGEAADSNIMSNAYWEEVKKKLLEYRLITEYPEEGRRKPYILGVNGFDYVIRTQLHMITDIENFVEAYQMYFPLVFGVWGKLREYGLVDYVWSNLAGYMEGIYLGLYEDFALGRRVRYYHQEFIEDLYTRIYLPELFKDELEAVPLDRLVEFRRELPEVLGFVNGYLVDQKTELSERLEKVMLVEKSLG